MLTASFPPGARLHHIHQIPSSASSATWYARCSGQNCRFHSSKINPEASCATGQSPHVGVLVHCWCKQTDGRRVYKA